MILLYLLTIIQQVTPETEENFTLIKVLLIIVILFLAAIFLRRK
jgi:L-asparagine transporter-like permease